MIRWIARIQLIRSLFVNVKLLVLSINLIFCSHLFANEGKIEKASENDYVNLISLLKNYEQTNDIEKLSNVTKDFYTADNDVIEIYKKDVKSIIENYSSQKEKIQTSALETMATSLKTALDACNAKLQIQKDASKAFGDSIAEASKLFKIEKEQEGTCNNGLKNAISLASSVKNKCNSLKDKDEKDNCESELKECLEKITKDQNTFKSNYLSKRAKYSASLAQFTDVSTDADYITANFPGSAEVCSNYSKEMASAEMSGNCIEKVKNDEINSSFGSQEISKNSHVEIDTKMLTPEHRIEVWKKLKEIADLKVKSTEDFISKITLEIAKIKEMDGVLQKIIATTDNVAYDNLSEADYVLVGTNSGHVISKSMIDAYFASKPSMDDILTKSTELGLTPPQLAKILNIAGFEGSPSNLLNFKETQERENQLLQKVNSEISKRQGSTNKITNEILIPNAKPLDMTQNVISKKGIITPAMVKDFLSTGPTDQQVFAKMYELGLRKSDLGVLLNGAELLFKDHDPRQILKNDSKHGSIFGRLDQELYRGDTGYGVSDPYDPNALIVKGTGHYMNETNDSWVPYGFKNVPNQRQDVRNLGKTPTNFSTGGIFEKKKY